MKWEDLKVYRPISKEELNTAKKEIEKIIYNELSVVGFKKYGRKLIRLSDDLFHIIHLDSRGSWSGPSRSLQTEIAIISVYDTETLVQNFEPISGLYLQNLNPNLRDYNQITSEYKLFANFISRQLKEFVLPFFNNHSNSREVLKNEFELPLNRNLVLFCELSNHTAKKSIEIIKSKIDILKSGNDNAHLAFWLQLKSDVDKSYWDRVDEILKIKKVEVYKKLKINSASS